MLERSCQLYVRKVAHNGFLQQQKELTMSSLGGLRIREAYARSAKVSEGMESSHVNAWVSNCAPLTMYYQLLHYERNFTKHDPGSI
jgi:hypothetical protein